VKKIEALIRPFKLEEVRDALQAIGIEAMKITEVKVASTSKHAKESFASIDYVVDYLPKVQIDLIVPEAQLPVTIDAILQAASTGKDGDGQIFIYDVVREISICNGISVE
jgi:nitrogen regulatory protein P-II 1